ncbi:peptide-methionine (S)-S-oxide reductase, partial [Lutibacter sp.]|uniref:peptide-methionine (S)-S-oxide reductase n=1 Tax=Lutibacter sp. TaxID=1925666 RepID=UPI00356272C0
MVFGLSESIAQSTITKKNKMNKKIEIATVGNGCFWCTEAIFQRLKGVESVT